MALYCVSLKSLEVGSKNRLKRNSLREINIVNQRVSIERKALTGYF